jgi:serine/threonine-protein kinase
VAKPLDTYERFAKLAVQKGFVRPEQLVQAAEEGRARGRSLGEIFLEHRWLTLEEIEDLEAEAAAAGTAKKPAAAALPEEVRAAAALPKNRIGKFILVRILGEGGMGQVVKAWDKPLARYVAIKFLHVSGKDDRERLLAEARTAAKLEHPFIVPVYEVGEGARGPFIVMKYVEGTTFDRAKIKIREKVTVLRDAAQAIAHAHSHGVVHRDLKPENVMVTFEGGAPKACVMDFGLARGKGKDGALEDGRGRGDAAVHAARAGEGAPQGGR